MMRRWISTPQTRRWMWMPRPPPPPTLPALEHPLSSPMLSMRLHPRLPATPSPLPSVALLLPSRSVLPPRARRVWIRSRKLCWTSRIAVLGAFVNRALPIFIVLSISADIFLCCWCRTPGDVDSEPPVSKTATVDASPPATPPPPSSPSPPDDEEDEEAAAAAEAKADADRKRAYLFHPGDVPQSTVLQPPFGADSDSWPDWLDEYVADLRLKEYWGDIKLLVRLFVTIESGRDFQPYIGVSVVSTVR